MQYFAAVQPDFTKPKRMNLVIFFFPWALTHLVQHPLRWSCSRLASSSGLGVWWKLSRHLGCRRGLSLPLNQTFGPKHTFFRSWTQAFKQNRNIAPWLMDTDDRGSDLTRLSASCFLPLGGIEMQTGPQFQDRWKLKMGSPDWKGASDSCNVSNRWRDTMWNSGFGGDSKAWYEVRISRWGHSHSRSAFECAPGEAGHPHIAPGVHLRPVRWKAVQRNGCLAW